MFELGTTSIVRIENSNQIYYVARLFLNFGNSLVKTCNKVVFSRIAGWKPTTFLKKWQFAGVL